jgi:methyl-accepting chemotaxis protein
MLKLGKLRRSDPRAILERVPATELADLRGQVQAIGRSQAVIEFALDGTIQTANEKVIKYCTEVTEQKMRAADFEGQVKAIDKSQAVIEFELDGVIRNANENFLRTVGYSIDEIRGRHHRMFVAAAYAESAEYRAFWEKLGRGDYDAGVYRRVGKGSREIWLQASYNPIFDASGRPVKVVKYASDISAQKKLTERLSRVMAEIRTAGTEIQLSA